MRLKNKEIRLLALQMEKLQKKNFPAKVSFAIAKNQKEISDTLQIIEEQRKKICEKYAKKDENGKAEIEGGAYVIQDPQGLKEEYQELMEIETEIDLQKMDEADLEKCGEGKYDAITPDDARILQYMM